MRSRLEEKERGTALGTRPAPLATDQLFNARHAEAYWQQATRCVDLVRCKVAEVDRPFTGACPEELKGLFATIDLNRPLGELRLALEELERVYLDDAVYFHHPRYVAHLNCPIVLPGILAEAILSPINSSLDTFDQSAGGTFIEQSLIDWTADRIGLGQDADGVFTSGGTQSNLMALMIARDHHGASLSDHGGNKHAGLPADYRRLRILGSAVSHFSLQKSAAILGLGYQAVMPVACDAHYRMDPAALKARLEECLAMDLIPIAVVATAGTTDFGSIDPLEEIAALCREHGIWLHVDAAYGGGLLCSRRYRHRLAGIEHADSVTIDYHKTFFQPVSCSAFLVRRRSDLRHVTHHADYLNPLCQAEAGTPDQVNKSLQTTKRFDALKLWLTLRIMGAEALGEMFERVIDLAGEAHAELARHPEIELLLAPPMSTLVFRYRPAGLGDTELDALNAYVRAALSRHGEAVIAATRVGGRRYLKFTLLNPDTRLEDLTAIVERIVQHGRDWCAAQAPASAAAS
ncbi:aspartate aminotransferase family protein [Halomonas campisalis]|uniref:Aspartate aminotransferase family protein n=1 Tax=Billgrantia campisalis TaxID=74661 RepID=A0ABS9P8I5_9GAMM|nr:aspartate aminotransferase family protein [Halomonas campisalis]MCG6657779.1 aspartate aminotransferase family protein [Halomonas campisalis]MDR5862449.1 aspartate aminotransferase family protein [Halomonas campisalis]